MKCRRIDIWRKLSAYENRTLSAPQARRLESHFLHCNDCKDRLARLRRGQAWAKSMPQVNAPRDIWDFIELNLVSKSDARGLFTRPWVWAAASVLSLCLLFIFILWQQNQLTANSRREENTRYRVVEIAEMPKNTDPHVVTEGFVSEVRVDAEDGDTLFRLVEHPTRREPFVVCEIISPYKLEPPPIGSRVRVFGVSRFDSKEEHRWFEVHPVLKIQTIQ
jgi:hypothetical protein